MLETLLSFSRIPHRPEEVQACIMPGVSFLAKIIAIFTSWEVTSRAMWMETGSWDMEAIVMIWSKEVAFLIITILALVFMWTRLHLDGLHVFPCPERCNLAWQANMKHKKSGSLCQLAALWIMAKDLLRSAERWLTHTTNKLWMSSIFHLQQS